MNCNHTVLISVLMWQNYWHLWQPPCKGQRIFHVGVLPLTCKCTDAATHPHRNQRTTSTSGDAAVIGTLFVCYTNMIYSTEYAF